MCFQFFNFFILFSILFISIDADQSARELRMQGNRALASNDYELALKLFDSAITKKPEDFNSHFGRYEALLQLKRKEDALQALEDTITHKNDYLKARVNRAQLLIERDELEAAEADLTFVLNKKPKHSLANIVMKKLQRSKEATASAEFLKDVDENVACNVLVPKLSSAIAGLPHDSTAAISLRLKRANCAADAGDHSSVLDDTRRVLSLDSRNVEALFLRGLALESLGEDEAAAQHFNQCARHDPDNKPCKWHWKRARLVHTKLADARNTQSLDAVDAAAAGASALPGDFSRAAKRQTRSCGSDDAKRVLGEGLCDNGGGYHRAELLRLRCAALARSQRDDETAVELCLIAANENPESDEPLCNRADVLRRLGKYDAAIADYNKAQQINPRSGRAANGKHHAEHERKLSLRKDYYKLLGVEKTATARVIKRAYRKLAAQHHPDKAAEEDLEESERIYLEIGEAYEILLDEKKRALYDQGQDYEDIKKAEQFEQQQQANPFGGRGGGGGQRFNFRWG